LMRVIKAPTLWSYVLPLAIIKSASGLYELVEMWVALIVSPELGAAYLGTQGDEWDAQKDMAAAMFGSLLCLAIIVVVRKYAQKPR